jgi:hypothetical protein
MAGFNEGVGRDFQLHFGANAAYRSARHAHYGRERGLGKVAARGELKVPARASPPRLFGYLHRFLMEEHLPGLIPKERLESQLLPNTAPDNVVEAHFHKSQEL